MEYQDFVYLYQPEVTKWQTLVRDDAAPASQAFSFDAMAKASVPGSRTVPKPIRDRPARTLPGLGRHPGAAHQLMESHVMKQAVGLDPKVVREAFGHYPSGLAAIAAFARGQAACDRSAGSGAVDGGERPPVKEGGRCHPPFFSLVKSEAPIWGTKPG